MHRERVTVTSNPPSVQVYFPEELFGTTGFPFAAGATGDAYVVDDIAVLLAPPDVTVATDLDAASPTNQTLRITNE